MKAVIEKKKSEVLHINASLFDKLKVVALRERQSIDAFAEMIIAEAVKEPNETTLQSMRDIENGVGLKKCDSSSVEAFLRTTEE